MKIDPIPAFEDNYFWVLHDDQRCIVVDPGDAAPVQAWLAQRGLSLVGILITHHHADHVGGVVALRAAYGPIPVYGPANEKIPALTHPLREGDAIDPLDVQFTVWDVPGHTSGHIAYIAEGFAFVGDTLFAGGCGRLFEGTPKQMWTSLSRLAQLPEDTKIFCAHEYTLSNLRFAMAVDPDNAALFERNETASQMRARGEPTVPFTIEQERATNPFIRADTQALRESAERYVNRTLESAVEVFTTLRTMKNGFR